jgi:hypothetical protein
MPSLKERRRSWLEDQRIPDSTAEIASQLISIRLRYGRLRAVEKPETQNASGPVGHSTKTRTYLELPTNYGMWNCSDFISGRAEGSQGLYCQHCLPGFAPSSRVREFGLVSVSDREPTDKAGDSSTQHFRVSERQSIRVLRSSDFSCLLNL